MPQSFETKAIHAGHHADPLTGSLVEPLHLGASYRLPGFGIKLFDALNLQSEEAAHVYSRWSNPTLRSLEKRLAALEEAQSGLVFATGMAAISALFLTFLNSGDHIIASEVCYAGTVELLGIHMPRWGVQVSLVDTSDLQQVEDALRPNTRMVFIETPANPVLRITDIAAVSQIAHAAGALLAVDSTFASPALQKPITLGADYVVHSLTKYINGHGDALGGVILGPSDGVRKIRREMLVHLGGAMAPFNAFLVLRGIETLPLRMKQHCANAAILAEFLENHPRVERVFYPGLPSHPHHALASRQMSAPGGMVSFRLKGGLGAAITLAEKIRVFTYATSLGHPNSLLFFYPYDLYVDAMPFYTPLQKAGIHAWTGDGLLRASVGLEDAADLVKDLDQALRGRTFKGLVGPLAYRSLKALKK